MASTAMLLRDEDGCSGSNSKRARVEHYEKDGLDISGSKPILHRFLQLGTAARCTHFGPHFEAAAQCLGHYEASSRSFATMVRDSVSPNALLWGDVENLSPSTRSKMVEERGEVTPTHGRWRGTYFTWLPKEYVSIALLQIEGSITVVYVPEKQSMFYASEVTKLPQGVPVGTVLVGVYTEDSHVSHRTPRVLVHDVLSWGSHSRPVSPLATHTACKRYSCLRENLLPLLQDSRYIVLQWCGFLPAARKFLTGGVSVGHEVGGLVAMFDNAAGAPFALKPEVVAELGV